MLNPGFPRILFMTALLLSLSACGGGESSSTAQIRLLNLSVDYPSLDLLTNDEGDDSDSDVERIAAVTTGTVTSYTTIKAAEYTVKIRRTGNATVLRSFGGVALTEEQKVTYVAYGNVGAFGVLSLEDDQDQPDSGKATVTVYNVSTAGSLDVYLTETSAALQDSSPVASSVTGSGSDQTIDSGTYRLRVTQAGDIDDVRLDIPAIELSSRSVNALFLTATPGGTLVEAVLLPQGGAVQRFSNTKARVRGANGIARAGAVTASLGGQTILSNAAVGVISSRYVDVEAGTLGLALRVDGVLQSSTNLVIQAGHDYTVLVWTDASGDRLNLIDEDNRAPTTTGRARMRLLNGMSRSATPLSLAIDYSPIIEGVAVGAASTATDTFSGTDQQIDVTNTTTAALVASRSGVSLIANSVYTLFVAEQAGGVTTVLRRDRE